MAEHRASDAARTRVGLDRPAWAALLSAARGTSTSCSGPTSSPSIGVSKKSDRWLPLLQGVRHPVRATALRNDTGIIGAALLAMQG